MSDKKNLGQFFTTNSDYILQGFEERATGKRVLDPFAGNGDLLNWAIKNKAISASGLDIDPSLFSKMVKQNDSLLLVPHEELIVTNPPYLGKNKMSGDMKAKYNLIYEDLYLHSVKRIMLAQPEEGILIIPVNFFSAENSDSLRKEFLNDYIITRINYFTQQVFDDTTYNVVAFHFYKNKNNVKKQNINLYIFPKEKKPNWC